MDLNCRICLQVRGVMVYIFEEVDQFQMEIAKLLEDCADLEIKKEDNFPKYLCQQCLQELLIVAEFRQKCKQSASLLQEMQSTKEDESESFEDTIVFEPLPEETDIPIETDQRLQKENDIHLNEVDAQVYEDIPSSTEMVVTEEARINKEIDEWFLKECADLNEENENSFVANIIEESTEETLPVEVEENVEENVPSILPKPSAESSLICKECGASFVKPLNLQRHREAEHRIVFRIFCENCKRNFESKEDYKEHSLHCHKAATKMVFSMKSGLKPSKDANRNICNYCGKKLQSNFALQMHVRIHTGERPFGCDYCKKNFKTQSALDVHIKRHMGTKDVECKICHKRFFEQSNLIVHMRTHNGDRPHTCSICNKSFSRVYLLQLHMRTHTGEKPFECEYCNRSFAQRSDWKSHLTIHTGLRRFQCDLCSKGFTKRQQFELHLEKHCEQRASNKMPENDVVTYGIDIDSSSYIDDLILEDNDSS